VVCHGTFFNKNVAFGVDIEDDQVIMDHEVDEAIQDLEDGLSHESEDDDEPQVIDNCVAALARPPSMLEAQGYIDQTVAYLKYWELPAKMLQHAECLQRGIWNHKLSLPKSSPTINTFFPKKTKKDE
jgi:hypothetical protein